MNQEFELKLQAWLDGELSAPEVRRLSQEMADDTEASRLVAELQAIKSALAGNEMPVAVPETREFYWSKIERQIEREAGALGRARPARPSTWLRWVSPLSGLAGLACIVLLAFQPFTPPAFDEISSTGEGMEAVTYHDQSTGMTVVWLADSQDSQPEAAPDVKSKSADVPDPEVEME